jgi:hypothetical protein
MPGWKRTYSTKSQEDVDTWYDGRNDRAQSESSERYSELRESERHSSRCGEPTTAARTSELKSLVIRAYGERAEPGAARRTAVSRVA